MMTKIGDGDGYDNDVNLILDDKDDNDDNCDGQDVNETVAVVVAVAVVGTAVAVSAAANDDGDDGFDVYDDSSLLVADEDCAEGWLRYYLYSGGNCYLFVQDKVTFDEGQAECEKKDARLVDLHVEAENSFVAGKMMLM